MQIATFQISEKRKTNQPEKSGLEETGATAVTLEGQFSLHQQH